MHHNIGPPRSFFIGSHQPVKFYANPIHNFEDMAIWFFGRFGLKCLFTPKNFDFYGSKPLNVIGHHRDPQKNILGRNRAYMPILVKIGPLMRPVRDMKESKKERKAMKETYCGKLGVRPDHPRWRSDMWSCMPGGLREIVVSFKFCQNRLNGFQDVGVEICHCLYLRPSVAYITACTTVLMLKKTFQFRTQCKGVKSHIQNCTNHFGEDTWSNALRTGCPYIPRSHYPILTVWTLDPSLLLG